MIQRLSRVWRKHLPLDFWTCSYAAIALLRILLSSDQRLGVIDASFDDALYLNQARAIVSGAWLGEYSHLSLAKGPFFAVYVALTHVLYVPLVLSYHLLYVTSCSLFIRAVAPLVNHPALRLMLFILLVFNPASFESQNHTRILRDGIYPALTMFVLSGAVGYFLRSPKIEEDMGFYGALLGWSFPLFWLTREEGIWLVPSVLLLLAFSWNRVLRRRNPHLALRARLKFLSIPFVYCSVVLSLFALLNLLKFGAFVLVETKTSAFEDAYGALMRVAALPPRALVPVRKENRLAAYQVSPAFSQLKSYLEGPIGESQIRVSCDEVRICDDIAGGWFIWAFRVAVESAGHYHERSAQEVLQYYETIAAEVNSACENGSLSCLPRRSGIDPPWLKEYSARIIPTLQTFVSSVFRFTDLSFVNVPSYGTEEFVQAAGQFTRNRTAPIEEGLRHSPWRETIMLWLAMIYERSIVKLGFVSLFIIYVLIASAPTQRTVRSLFWISVSLAGAFLARSLIFTYVTVSSYNAMQFRYFSPLQMIGLIFCGLCVASSLDMGCKLKFFRKISREISVKTYRRGATPVAE